MLGNKATRRDASKLIAAGTIAAGVTRHAHAAIAPSCSLVIDRAMLEWQRTPVAMDRRRPRFHWTLKAIDKAARGLEQSAYQIRIYSAADRALIFDTGRVPSAELNHPSRSDLPLISQQAYVWRLQVWDQTGAASTMIERPFSTGLLEDEDNIAQWIAFSPNASSGRRAIEGRATPKPKPDPLPIFRKIFDVTERPVFAHLVVVGAGQYQLSLNGRRVSPAGLNGGWTDFDKRVQYDGYDVTKWIKPGRQLIGVALGNGFFNVENIAGRYTKLDGHFGQPQLWLQLTLRYAGGRQETIVTDATWQTRIGGTACSSIFGGEDFDARLDDGAYGDSEDWRSVNICPGPAGRLEASTFAPAVELRALVGKKISKAQAEVWDFGLNHSGRPRIALTNMTPGSVVRLIPGELCLPDGTIDQQSMTGAKVPGIHGIWFTYTCRGGTREVWSPQFTYTGYRYLQIEGIPKGHLSSIESLVVRADLDVAGHFSCSDPNMESIHSLIRQALFSNTASVLTDCPTREKLGWLEQIYLNAATTMNNLDTVRLYEKMVRDMRDAQEASGMVPSIAPEFIKFLDKDGKSTAFRDTPEWGAAIVLAPWYVYQRYGDVGILAENLAAMVAYADYLGTRLGADGLLDFGLGDWYDFGPKAPGFAQLTSRKMTGTATYFALLTTLERIATILNNPAADRFAARAIALKSTMQDRLFNRQTAAFDTGSQTAQAMALVLDLLPPESRDAALAVLVRDIRARADHVTAGDIGFHYVVRALADNGHSDVLHDMLSRTDKPAYLQQIHNGATALTEAWDSWRSGSQNHFMLGHAELWFFQGLGGVRVDFSANPNAPIVLEPQPVARVERCAVESESVVGRICCAVSTKGSERVVEVEVPAGQTARLRLPYPAGTPIIEGNTPVASALGVAIEEAHSDQMWLRLGSGTYRFTGHLGV
jgi:alpha-L-rhamnosidase